MDLWSDLNYAAALTAEETEFWDRYQNSVSNLWPQGFHAFVQIKYKEHGWDGRVIKKYSPGFRVYFRRFDENHPHLLLNDDETEWTFSPRSITPTKIKVSRLREDLDIKKLTTRLPKAHRAIPRGRVLLLRGELELDLLNMRLNLGGY